MKLMCIPLVLALSACSMTPVLDRPEAPIPAAYPLAAAAGDGADGGHAAANGADIGWQTMFGDPRMQQLIGLALQHNRDLRLATLNVEAVQAQYRIARAAQLPAVDASANALRQRAGAGQGEAALVQKQVGAGLGISAFELDLWGRARALSDAAFARYLASDDGRRAARLSLIAAVADACIAEQLAEEQAGLARQTLDAWTEQGVLAGRLMQAMQSSGIELAQARGQVARARAALEARMRERQRAHNALVLLVGSDLDAVRLPPPLPLAQQPLRTRLPAGLPSALLVNRPDIRQAEQNLRAANADIGAARAAFLPRISLTATAGVASPALDDLFRGGSRAWSFAPQLTLPLFNGGQLRAELRMAQVRKSSAVAEYERAIQQAFREVADGLAGSATYANQLAAQVLVVEQERKRAALSEQRYRAGVDGRLELLDAQRQLYLAQQELLDLRRDEIGNAIALYKALGGGQFRADPVAP